MSLKDMISESQKEIAGSRTKNRLTVQVSYAIQLIMDFYSTDFLVMMDYIEDISIICNPDAPSEIHLYQVKTKSSDKQMNGIKNYIIMLKNIRDLLEAHQWYVIQM